MSNTKETLYDWNTAPDWAQWAAMDDDGVAYWYDSHPNISGVFGFWYAKTNAKQKPFTAKTNKFPVNQHWNKSLEQRPQEK